MPDTPSFDPRIHHRRSIRLRGYDYSQAGAYFVTLCTHERACLFGAVEGDAVRLNEAGCVVQHLWNELPEHFSGIELDAFVVMPNHVHGIVVLNDLGAMNRAPTIGEIVRAYKARCTRDINRLRGMQSVSILQPIITSTSSATNPRCRKSASTLPTIWRNGPTIMKIRMPP